MSPGCSELIFCWNKGVLLTSKWGKLFIWFQTLPLCLDEKLRAGMKWLNVGGLGGGVEGLPAALTLINWELVGLVEISVLKWASVSSSPSPGALRDYLVVILSNFLGFFRTLPFIPKRNHLKRKRFLPSPLTGVTLWAMM